MTRPYDALVVSEARTKAIVDSALDCVVTMDSGGRIVEWNPSAERCFGRTAAEVIGRDLAEVIIPFELRDAHREGLTRYFATLNGIVSELDGVEELLQFPKVLTLPCKAPPRSVRMSPKRFDPTTTSRLSGCNTKRAASASTWYGVTATSG